MQKNITHSARSAWAHTPPQQMSSIAGGVGCSRGWAGRRTGRGRGRAIRTGGGPVSAQGRIPLAQERQTARRPWKCRRTRSSRRRSGGCRDSLASTATSIAHNSSSSVCARARCVTSDICGIGASLRQKIEQLPLVLHTTSRSLIHPNVPALRQRQRGADLSSREVAGWPGRRSCQHRRRRRSPQRPHRRSRSGRGRGYSSARFGHSMVRGELRRRTPCRPSRLRQGPAAR